MKTKWIPVVTVLAFLLLAVSIPIFGIWQANQDDAVMIHARMAENGGWTPMNLTAVVGQPLKLRLTSDDVVHGFAVGQSDQKPVDVIPGEIAETTLVFDHPGKYTFYCTRWCGANHWRMRGTIDVTGPAMTDQPKAESQPLFLKLGINVDVPHTASVVPSSPTFPERGAKFASRLPAYATDRNTYLITSPSALWQKLRSESALQDLSDADLWDAVAWIGQNQTPPEKLSEGQQIYASNCAACHGEGGKGDGVMVRSLPLVDPMNMTAGKVRPGDFTDPHLLLGASPALLEGKIIRGGMGTGMPSWGAILTDAQMDAVLSYMYTFAWKSAAKP
jgi:mono/diheme cytochrome c family protein